MALVGRDGAQDRLERAVHEAGHTVAAIALRMGVGAVTIRTDESGDGHVMVSDDGPLEARAMVRLAGREALLMSGLPVRGCRRDLDEARAYALEAAGDETDAEQLLVEWRVLTRELLWDRDVWRAHGAVAIALLERESLGGGELGSVLYWARLRSEALAA